MPISIKAPDGSIAQFPDGTSDHTIEKVMADHYPQPSAMDRVMASPVVRGLHDIVARPIAAVLNGPVSMGAMLPVPGESHNIAGDTLRTGPVDPADPLGVEGAYQRSLGRNRNAPGYAAERARAEAGVQARGGSGLQDQMFAPLLPTLASIAGLPGGMDSANAMADAQEAGQSGFAARHPVLSAGAGVLGGFLMGSPARPGMLATIVSSVTPEQAAARYVSRLGTDPSKLRAAANGKPFTTAEAIGKQGEVALGALARREGTTPDAFAGQMFERQQGAAGRMLEDFAQAGGISPEAAHGDLDSLVAAGRTRAAPAYKEALARPAVITDRLQDFAKEPLIQQGMKEGIKIERLKALAEGRPFDPNAYAITAWDAAGDPIIGAVPTWHSWDAAKTGLDDMLEVYRDKTTGRVSLDKKGSAINDVRKSMLRELDGVNPAYKDARGIAGDYLSAQDAFQQGGKALLNANMTEKQYADFLARMSPADLDAFKGGQANRIFDMAQNGKLNPKLFASPRVRAKLELTYGKDAARQLISNLEAENRMAGFARTRVPGAGSPTAEYQAAMADQDGAGSFAMDALDLASQASRNGIVRTVIGKAADKGRDAAAAYLTRGMGAPVRDVAGQLLMQSPADSAVFLENLPQLPPTGPLMRPRLTNRSALPYPALPQLLAPSGSVGSSR
jgi:hypothetical protein